MWGNHQLISTSIKNIFTAWKNGNSLWNIPVNYGASLSRMHHLPGHWLVTTKLTLQWKCWMPRTGHHPKPSKSYFRRGIYMGSQIVHVACKCTKLKMVLITILVRTRRQPPILKIWWSAISDMILSSSCL